MWRFPKKKYTIIGATVLSTCIFIMAPWSTSKNEIVPNDQFYSGALKDGGNSYSLKKDKALSEQFIKNINQQDDQTVARILEARTRRHSTITKDAKSKHSYIEERNFKKNPKPGDKYLNCSAVMEGNKSDLQYYKSIRHIRQSQEVLSDQNFAKLVHSCSYFKTKAAYSNHAISKEETDFPIAYVITMHRKPMQVEQLLRSIYSPQNLYCIHVDRKASGDIKQSIINIAQCLPNVFIARKLEDVQYATFSRLKADINCLQDLIIKNHSWKYAINLVGQDFPTKTNHEIITYLKKLNGTNDIPGELPTNQKIIDRYRYKHKHLLREGTIQYVHENETKSSPPNNIQIYFGTAFFFASRAFIKHILTDKLAKDLLEWYNDTYSPDESYWITLNSLPGVPGGRVTPIWHSSVRLIRWETNPDQVNEPTCQGQYVRTICVFGLGDLPWIVKQHHLFANKFDYSVDLNTLDCLEQWRETRTQTLNK